MVKRLPVANTIASGKLEVDRISFIKFNIYSPILILIGKLLSLIWNSSLSVLGLLEGAIVKILQGYRV